MTHDQVAAAFGMLPLFQSPMNILCEISDISKRGFVICVACVAWSLGQIVFPLVGNLAAMVTSASKSCIRIASEGS